MLTAQALYDMYKNGGQISPAMAFDLFGINNWPRLDEDTFHQRISIMDGLYKGLYLLNIPYLTIEKHRKSNTLDNLIHETYKKNPSGYYQQFCDLKMEIGRTQLL